MFRCSGPRSPGQRPFFRLNQPCRWRSPPCRATLAWHRGGPVPLAPGAYGSVTVFTSATLVLSGGDYYFRRLQVEPHAVVRLEKSGASIRVFVRDDVIYRGSFMHSDGSPDGFFLGYTGQTAVALESPLQGAVVAPNAQLTLGGNSPMAFTGQFAAMDINVRADVSVHHRAFECSNP